MKEKVERIFVIAQAFYGNRTGTTIKREDVDCIILGYLDSSLVNHEQIDRTIIRIPNSDQLVLIYNKYQEALKNKGKHKPLAVIPEEHIEIYSRCIVCRMDENGVLQSLQDGDSEKFMKYLAE